MPRHITYLLQLPLYQRHDKDCPLYCGRWGAPFCLRTLDTGKDELEFIPLGCPPGCARKELALLVKEPCRWTHVT
jgi:hypothetical protein